MNMSKSIIAALIAAMILVTVGGCAAIYKLEKNAAEYRRTNHSDVVVLGHRVGPNGQEMLIVAK